MLLSNAPSLSDFNRLMLHDEEGLLPAQFAYPATIFVKEQMLTLVACVPTRQFFDRYRRHLADAGAVACMSRIVETMPLDQGRSIQITHAAYLDFEGRVVTDSLVRATVTQGNGGLGIDILRFIKSPFDLRLDELVPLGAIG